MRAHYSATYMNISDNFLEVYLSLVYGHVKVYLGAWVDIYFKGNRMKYISTIHLLFVFMIVSFAPISTATSAQVGLQFIDNKTDPQLKQISSPIQKVYNSGHTIKLNRDIFQTMKVGNLLTINLIPERDQEVTVQNIITNSNGSLSYVARSKNAGAGNFSIITVSERTFFATIISPDGIFVANGQGNTGKLINEKNLTPFFSEDIVDTSDGKYVADAYQSSGYQAYRSAEKALPEISHIGLLVLRTPGTDELYGGDPNTRIHHLIAVTNQIYQDSNVAIQFDLVGIDRVEYDDNLNYSGVLADMRFESHPAFENLHLRRYELGADYVTIMPPTSDGTVVGSSSGGGTSAGLIYGRDSAYSYVAIGTADYVLAHELGHNLGLTHSRKQDAEGFTFPYALGNGVDANFVTVMASSQEFSNAQKIYRFSSPELLCNDLPCGVDHNDILNGADAVFAMNQVREQAADFYDEVPSLITIEEVLAEGFDPILGECVLQTPNVLPTDYAGNLEEISCYSLSTNSLEGLYKFPHLTELRMYNAGITNISHLWGLSNIHGLDMRSNSISDISALSALPYLKSISLTDNIITDLNPLSELQNLYSLSIENNQVRDITPISLLPRLAYLDLSNNRLETIEPIKYLTSLISLRLIQNNLSDISILANNINLSRLILSENNINDIESLKNLPLLWKLDLENNHLSDISPLFGLLDNKLEIIHLAGNNNIYCWQQQYMTQNLEAANFSISDICSDSDDNNDFDNDGVSNIKELEQGTSPTVSQLNLATKTTSGGGSMSWWIILVALLGFIFQQQKATIKMRARACNNY